MEPGIPGYALRTWLGAFQAIIMNHAIVRESFYDIWDAMQELGMFRRAIAKPKGNLRLATGIVCWGLHGLK